MPDADVLKRIEAHIEKGNALMHDVRIELQLSRETYIQQVDMIDNMHTFTRDQLRLVYKLLSPNTKALEDLTASVQRLRDEIGGGDG